MRRYVGARDGGRRALGGVGGLTPTERGPPELRLLRIGHFRPSTGDDAPISTSTTTAPAAAAAGCAAPAGEAVWLGVKHERAAADGRRGARQR